MLFSKDKISKKNIKKTYSKKKKIVISADNENNEQVKMANTAVDLMIDKVFDSFQRVSTKGALAMGKIYKKYRQSSLMRTLTRCEEKSSSAMCSFIDYLDNNNELISQKAHGALVITGSGIQRLREGAERNKKKLLTGFGACVIVTGVFLFALGSVTAYEYAYNGKVLGIVKNQSDVHTTIDIIGDKLSQAYDAEITIDKERDISFNKVFALNKKLDNKEDILNNLTYMKDMKATGYGLYIDGRLTAILDSEASVRSVLAEIKSMYTSNSEDVEYKQVDFVEDVDIKEVETKLGKIKKKDDIMEYMLTGSTEKKIHVVQSGETLSHISKMYDMKLSELIDSNPQMNPDKLAIGDEISLTQAVPVATVKTVEIATYNMPVEYEITYENTSAMYEGEKRVKSQGIEGQREVVAEITRQNGIETDRKEIRSTVLSEPVPQVVLVGTKKLPPLVGTGSFQYPVRGRLSSGFGQRWGRLHKGIDLAAPTGTKISAADGGKVIFAGYNGSLGYMVKIDHGGGKVTLYGHCSKLFVKKGERVYKGQHIANVGNTGRSTGPHLHFEIHVNGVPKNPLNYL